VTLRHPVVCVVHKGKLEAHDDRDRNEFRLLAPLFTAYVNMYSRMLLICDLFLVRGRTLFCGLCHIMDPRWWSKRAHWRSYDARRHTETRCNTLQCTAAHCNTLQHTATHCNTLQHTATHCNTLQLTATHCDALQRTATTTTYCGNRVHWLSCDARQDNVSRCSTLQRIATHRNALQRTAMHCGSEVHWLSCDARQHTAAHCNSLRHAATHCNTLRRFAYDGFTRVTLGVHTIWGAIRSYYHFSLTLLRRTAAHCNPLQHTADLCAIYRLNSESFQILFRGLLKIFGGCSTLFNSIVTKTWFACVCASNTLPTLFREFWLYSESFWLCSVLL